MKYTDEYISMKLKEIGKTSLEAAPIEGDWQTPPYQDMIVDNLLYAVIIIDSVFSVAVNRISGEVKFFDNDIDSFDYEIDKSPSLINSTLEQFCQCAIRWSQLSAFPEDIEDKQRENIALLLESDLAKIDPLALCNENQLWSFAVEEFSYGIYI